MSPLYLITSLPLLTPRRHYTTTPPPTAVQFDCDKYWSSVCLSDDRSETLEDAKGVAPGAKLAILDLGSSEKLEQILGGPMWEAAAGTGARLHSASWGFPDEPCTVDAASVSFDEWLFEVRIRRGKDRVHEPFLHYTGGVFGVVVFRSC